MVAETVSDNKMKVEICIVNGIWEIVRSLLKTFNCFVVVVLGLYIALVVLEFTRPAWP